MTDRLPARAIDPGSGNANKALVVSSDGSKVEFGTAGTDAEGVRDAVAAFLVAGTNITLDHNDPADTLTVSATAALTLDGLTDVDTTTTPPTDGQALVFSTAGSEWRPGTVSSGAVETTASASITRSAAYTVQATGVDVFVKMPWDALIQQTGSLWSAGTPDRLTAASDGWYNLYTQIAFEANQQADYFVVQFRVNGSQVTRKGSADGGINWPTYDHAATVYLNQNDYVEVWYENRGDAGALLTGGTSSYFSLMKAGGVQGETGPTGPQGSTGPQGPTGPTGPGGAAYVHIGPTQPADPVAQPVWIKL